MKDGGLPGGCLVRDGGLPGGWRPLECLRSLASLQVCMLNGS